MLEAQGTKLKALEVKLEASGAKLEAARTKFEALGAKLEATEYNSLVEGSRSQD